jgi:hypothetical protein
MGNIYILYNVKSLVTLDQCQSSGLLHILTVKRGNML